MGTRKRRNYFYSCLSKRVHYNFMSAMGHCISLQKIEPFSQLFIYKCDFCPGMHVTRSRSVKSMKKVLKALRTNLHVMRNPEWWLKAPPDIIDRRISLEIELVKKALGLKPIRYRNGE